jgi:hypothetical protein
MTGTEEGIDGTTHGDGARLTDSGEGTLWAGDGDFLNGEGVMDEGGADICIELGEFSPPSSRYKEELGVMAGVVVVGGLE